MSTKTTNLSQTRQKHQRELVIWDQKIKEIRYELAHFPKADTNQKLSYCESERQKSYKALENLSTSQTRWAHHGFLKDGRK
jgi:hypothetical protein